MAAAALRLSRALALSLFAGAAAAATSPTPNVLFIAVDDLRPEHGAFGGRAVTPHIDAFAKTAARFGSNYVQVGVCSPSRASLLTGRYPDTTHVTDLWHYFRDIGANYTTLPQRFLREGYLTRGAGKIFHPGHASGAGDFPDGGPCGAGCEGNNDPPSWDGYQVPPSSSLPPWSLVYNLSWYALDEGEFPVAEHPDAQSADYIIAQLRAGSPPFFLAPGFLKPHLPFIFPAPFLDLYSNYSEIAADADPPTGGAIREWTAWGELRSYEDVAALIVADNLTEALETPCNCMPRAKAIELRRAYFAATSFNDAMVGRVLDALTAEGHDNDTVVVLFGDHGWNLGDHGDWTKHDNYESVVRAPLLIRSPQHPQSAGRAITALTSHIDIFPTILELTGLAPEPGLQGHSLVPLLVDPALPALSARPYAYSQYPRNETACKPVEPNCGFAHAMGYRVRTNEYAYIEWVAFDNVTHTPDFDDPNVVVELYDHRGDTGANWPAFERANVAGDPRYAEVQRNLSAVLHAGPNLLHPARK